MPFLSEPEFLQNLAEGRLQYALAMPSLIDKSFLFWPSIIIDMSSSPVALSRLKGLYKRPGWSPAKFVTYRFVHVLLWQALETGCRG